jgi:hypothetical protein
MFLSQAGFAKPKGDHSNSSKAKLLNMCAGSTGIALTFLIKSSPIKTPVMIPVLIVMLMRRYQKNNPQQFIVIRRKLLGMLRVVVLLAAALLFVIISRAQEKTLSYAVKRNGTRIGDMLVREVRDGSTVYLKLQSDIKTSFILTLTARGVEEARYDSGVLVYSSVYQNLNGTEKINKQITYVKDAYVVSSKGKEEKLNNLKIYYNLVCIYNHEPTKAALIFSDKYLKFLPIEKIEDHHYRIRFPDGSFNDYWFENGVCKKIKADHQFYTATMELNQ